jgi:hypothetical protein
MVWVLYALFGSQNTVFWLRDSVRELENFTSDLFERQVDSFFKKE